LREGLRLLEEREKRIAALDLAIARGRADVAAGRVKPADEVLKRLDAKYRKMAKSRA
jgi:antitoxin ParD1/3/4